MTTSGAGGQGRGQPRAAPPLVAIVDDDASVRRSTGRLIRSFGYRAEAFASGKEFLASPLAVRTACLVLDVRMPDMDGLEVQHQLTARHLHVPVVFISGRRRGAPGASGWSSRLPAEADRRGDVHGGSAEGLFERSSP